jgi:hypothetical protein
LAFAVAAGEVALVALWARSATSAVTLYAGTTTVPGALAVVAPGVGPTTAATLTGTVGVVEKCTVVALALETTWCAGQKDGVGGRVHV